MQKLHWLNFILVISVVYLISAVLSPVYAQYPGWVTSRIWGDNGDCSYSAGEDPKFPYTESLEIFLGNVNPFHHKEIIKKISRACKIQLLILSGLFIKEPDSRVDLLVAGDDLKEGMLENVIKTIESEIGREVRYASFETSEFKYRYSMFDKLIRDILDYPHEKVVNKIGL